MEMEPNQITCFQLPKPTYDNQSQWDIEAYTYTPQHSGFIIQQIYKNYKSNTQPIKRNHN